MNWKVTSTSIKQYDICGDSGADITDSNGFITSPGYGASFQAVTNECKRSIRAPADKVINIWFVDMNIKGPDSTQTYAGNFFL